MGFLEQILTSACLESIVDDPGNEFSYQLMTLSKNEISKCGDPNKIMTSADVFCQLLQSGGCNTVKKCLTQLSIFLCHKFPRVRKSSAEKLYEAILTFSDKDIVPDENLESVMEILTETQWDDSIEKLSRSETNSVSWWRFHHQLSSRKTFSESSLIALIILTITILQVVSIYTPQIML